MMLDRVGIQRIVPQTGTMCLLDTVTRWDDRQILCIALPPGAAHPLDRDGVVPAVAAVEYAAQATAIHGALLSNATAPNAGLLAKLTDVSLLGESIPTDAGLLNVEATLLSASAAGCLYTFEVTTALGPLAHGRLMVAFSGTA